MVAGMNENTSDVELFSAVSRVLAEPKAAPADSFVLHASLELLARVGLLRYVHPDARAAARRRLLWLADTYAAAGDPVEPPARYQADSVEDGAAALVAALAAGDLDDVDAIATWLGAAATPADLRRLLAQPVAASLAAAAHGSILLYLFPRVAPGGEVDGGIIRGPLRELARHPDWRLRWFEDPDEPSAGGSLSQALLDVPLLGVPGSSFIFPIMSQAEETGIAPKLLSGLLDGGDLRTARRQLARVAAWSMLQEPDDHANYGWSHCLTMPQAVMGVAGAGGVDARTATAVAATHVVGFRAALGSRSLVPEDPPSPPSPPVDVTGLATYAALHEDAHLAKYTLACLDAAADDPEHRGLYLAAADRLATWWKGR